MSESSCELHTMRIGLDIILHDSPDVPAGVADRNIIDDLGAMADPEAELMQLFKNPGN